MPFTTSVVKFVTCMRYIDVSSYSMVYMAVYFLDERKELLMTQFHQEHQQVCGQQQNAGRDIHNANQTLTFGSVQRSEDLAALLTQLQDAIAQATADGTLPKKTGIDTKAALEKAMVEAEEPQPDKKSLLDYLTTAKTLIESIAAASGLIPSIVTAIEAVHKIL